MTLWFVDNSLGTGSNNGTSWANAWHTIAAVTWASLGPDDTLFISGGSSSQTYSELLLVGAHTATAGHPLTITAGDGTAGHTGTVIIDGATSTLMDTANGIVDNNAKTNLIIQNLTLQNTLENCLYLHGVTTGTVLCQGLTIHTGNGTATLTTNATTAVGNAILHFASVPADIIANPGSYSIADALGKIPAQSFPVSATSTSITLNNTIVGSTLASGATITYGANARGVRVTANSGGTVTVQNSTIDTPANTIAQTDGIFSVSNTGATVNILGILVTINNINPDGHNDGIQTFNDGGTININGNAVFYPTGGLGNNHCCLLADPLTGGTTNVFNNVFFMGPHAISAGTGPDPGSGVIIQQTLSGTTNGGTFNFYNNTIVGGSPGIAYGMLSAPNPTFNVKNNLIYTNPLDSVPVSLTSGALPTPANHANNLLFADNTSLTRLSATTSTIGACRGTVSQSTGLRYFEMQLGYVFTGANSMMGIANASKSLTTFVGDTTNSVGYEWDVGRVYLNNTIQSTIQLAAPGDLIGFAFDFTHSKVWIINWNTGQLWNNAAIGTQDPASNTGGISIAGLAAGPYFICESLQNDGTYTVLNTGSTAFGGTMPSGFSAWGGTWNGSDISTVTLTAPVGFISGATKTWAAWQAAGYDASGVNADPKLLSVSPAVPGNLQIQTTSPARNAGATLAAVTTDFNGRSRPQGAAYDIGAFEVLLWAQLSGGGGQHAIIQQVQMTGY